MDERTGIKLVIADDHPVVVAGLEALLGDRPSEYRIMARCMDAASALQAIRRHSPHVALLKLEFADTFGMLRTIRRAHRGCGVILFGSKIDEEQALEAFRLGARGLLLKTLPVQLIEECIRKVANGERWIEKSSAARVLERLATGQPAGLDGHRADGLTPRETELVELASTGLRNREIARRLGIAEGTVKVHLHNIYRKLGVRGRLQLAHYAATHGIV